MHPTCPNLPECCLPSACVSVEGDQSLTDLRFIEREDVFAIDAGQLSVPFIGRQPPRNRVPALRAKDIFHVRRAARLSLQMDSRSHRYDPTFFHFITRVRPKTFHPRATGSFVSIFTSVNRRAWRNAVLALSTRSNSFCIFGSRNTFGISMS